MPSAPDVFAIGDCSGYLESTGKATLPALAQVSGHHMPCFQLLFSGGAKIVVSCGLGNGPIRVIVSTGRYRLHRVGFLSI